MKNFLKCSNHLARRAACGAVLGAVVVLAGCATGPADRRDPLETVNRAVFHANDVVDRAVVKPVARVYRDVLPSPVRSGVTNFFNNLQDAWSVVNNALQGKGQAAGNSLMRFEVNTFLGLGGVLDIASEMQIERSSEDFGQTLGFWGVGSGPYLVLPLLGPSTVRDTAALVVDAKGDLLSNVAVPERNSAKFLDLLDERSRLLGATDMLDQVALDPYTFTRDSFLQRRRSRVFDGNPPDEILPDVQDSAPK
jgi:phospholipid-binding lipoprotein MlaA